jgi:hypothetical protein
MGVRFSDFHSDGIKPDLREALKGHTGLGQFVDDILSEAAQEFRQDRLLLSHLYWPAVA